MYNTGDKERPGVRMGEVVAASVVIAAFVIVAVVATRTVRRHEEVVSVAANIQQLREILFAANRAADPAKKQVPLWPTNGCESSTKFFISFFNSGLYTNAFPSDLLSGPGVPAFSGTNIVKFAPSNNIWCITIPSQSQTNDFPFLFTRNFLAGNDGKGTNLADVSILAKKVEPFGADVGVVVSYLGTVKIIRAGDLTNKAVLPRLFNPSGASNTFLSPWPPRHRPKEGG